MKMMKLIGEMRGALLAAILAAAAFATLPLAADTPIIYATASDSTKTLSSFVQGNENSIFGDASHPSPGNDYVVKDNLLIYTPATSSPTSATNIVFLGDSLSLGDETIGDATGSSEKGQFVLKTAYTDDSKRAMVTINDFRLYNRALLNAANGGSKKYLIAGNITVYASSDYMANFACSGNSNTIFEVSSKISGIAGTGILFNQANYGSELRMTGDMSDYKGVLSISCGKGARLVLANACAASGITVNANDYLTLGPNFSYVGTETITIPAGTRFTAAYDAGTGTTIPVVMDAEHFTLAASGKFEVSIDAASLPADDNDYIGKVLPIVKIPRSVREVTEADFTDVTEGIDVDEYGLPYSWVQVETDNAGMQTVSIKVYPHVKLLDTTKTSVNSSSSDGYWYLDDAVTWEDGNVPSPGKDYLVQFNPKSNLLTPRVDDYIFPGHSLTLCNDPTSNQNPKPSCLLMYCKSLTVSNFIVKGRASIQAAANGVQSVVDGKMCFLDTTESAPAAFVVRSARRLDLRSKISGDGYMRVRVADSNGRMNISGDNSEFTGQIEVATYTSSGTTYTGTILAFDAPENLGGAPATFNYKALSINNTCVLAPTKPMTLATANRGIWFNTPDAPGKIVVTNGTFGIMEPIRMNGTLQKEGTGVLALGGDVTFGADGTDAPSGANNVLNVAAGGILPLTTNGFANLSISFEAGTRLIADAAATDAGVQEYGLFNSYGAFTLPSDGKLRVSIVNVPEDVMEFSVPICTVTQSAAAALTDNVAVDKISRKSVVVRQESVSVNGQTMVRFFADVANRGFAIIVL